MNKYYLFFLAIIAISISSVTSECNATNCHDCTKTFEDICFWCQTSQSCTPSGTCSGFSIISPSQCCEDSYSKSMNDCESCNKETGCVWCRSGENRCMDDLSCDSSDVDYDCSSSPDVTWPAYVFPAIWVIFVVAAIIQKKKNRERQAGGNDNSYIPVVSQAEEISVPVADVSSTDRIHLMDPPPMAYADAPPAYADASPDKIPLMCPQCTTPVGIGSDGQAARFCSGCGVAFA